MSDTPDIPEGEDPIEPVEPADSQPAGTNGNGHKNGKNGAHALDKPKNGNGNGNGKHTVDDPKEDGKESKNDKDGGGKNGSLFGDKRFQVGILVTLVIASLGVWWVIFQQVSDGNGRDLPAPASEFDPGLVTESTGDTVAASPVETDTQEPELSVDPELPMSEVATGDPKAVIEDASGITGDAELRERGFFDAIFKFRDPFQTPNPVTDPVTGSAG